MPILALDVKTRKLITTTQVITSVYTAVKELLENALDAGADNIEINLVDDGTSLIEVKDNGCGISKADAHYMCLPSYTSKISNFEDLDTLRTFGFRGEVLNALCTVAEVTIITKIDKDIVGTSYKMNCNGQILNQEPCHRSTGTTIQVKDLFKQIPVRRQMIINMRETNRSIKLLETLMQSFGMCKPNVRIQFRVNNNVVFTKPSLNDIKEAACHILGRKIISNMEWIEPMDIEFILKLMLPSKKLQNISEIYYTGLQYIFVNSRPIKHKELEKVVNNSVLEYFKQESHKKKVVFLVHITLDPIDIDVNLEPNKDAILFKDQDKVFDTINECIRTFYGLKLTKNIEQNVSVDASVCYEDDTFSTNEDLVEDECSASKKRKMHIQQKPVKKNSDKKEPVLINYAVTIENENIPQNNQQNNDQIYNEQHYRDMLDLSTCIQPLNLSDSDSNDASNTAISHDDNVPLKDHFIQETLSQLPVVDLGEDFDFIEMGLETSNSDIFTNENKDNLVDTPKRKQTLLETWSKGHVKDLNSGTDIKCDTAIVRKSNDNLIKKTNEISERDKAYIDSKSLGFIKHVRFQVVKENPTLPAAQAAKKITEFWKQLSSEERGYYRDIAGEGKKEHQRCKKTEEKAKIDAEKNKNRLLQLFKKMKNTKNEKNEKSIVRTIIPWITDRNKIITRSDYENGHIIGRLTSKLWIATICEQIWIVDIIRLIENSKTPNIEANKIDAKTIERFLKQWLLKQDDISVMHSIYKFKKKTNKI